jgi:hypothetical protein
MSSVHPQRDLPYVKSVNLKGISDKYRTFIEALATYIEENTEVFAPTPEPLEGSYSFKFDNKVILKLLATKLGSAELILLGVSDVIPTNDYEDTDGLSVWHGKTADGLAELGGGNNQPFYLFELDTTDLVRMKAVVNSVRVRVGRHVIDKHMRTHQ